MEYLDIYDIDRIKTGQTFQRGEKLERGQYHLVVHAVIFNSKNEMLIQQRCLIKKTWAGLWDVSMGGTVQAGESSRAACERELFEELGIKADLTGFRPSLTLNFSPAFDDIYLIREDIDTKKLTLQTEEVMGAKWATKEEIFSMIDDGTFVPGIKSFYNYIFELKDITGLTGVITGYRE